MMAMCERLAELGMPVSIHEVSAKASGSVGGRISLKSWLNGGYVYSKQEAFETWIETDCRLLWLTSNRPLRKRSAP